MPKGAPRTRTASTSLYTQDTVDGKYSPEDKVRAAVGDQGVAKLKAARKTLTKDDDTVSSSDKQTTPGEQKAASDDIVAKLKNMTKKAMKNGSTAVNRGLMDDDED